MSPTVLRVGPYRFFFNSREETRKHIHIATGNGVAKIWLEPVIALESYYNLKQKELREIEALVRKNENEFKKAWQTHFSQ